MNKRIICLVALFALFSSSLADTLLMRGSKPMTNLKDKIFLQGDEFIGLIQSEFMSAESKIEHVYVFDVSIKNKELISNPNLVMKEVSSFTNLRGFFGDTPLSYASTYIQNAYNDEFSQKLSNAAVASKFEVKNLKLHDFDFINQKNLVEMISMEWKDLSLLDKLLKKYHQKFESSTKNNFVVLLKFSDKTHEAVPEALNLSFAQINSRILEGETSNTQNTATPTIPISPMGLSGLVISILLGIFIYIAIVVLNDIKVPAKFFNKQFVVGDIQL